VCVCVCVCVCVRARVHALKCANLIKLQLSFKFVRVFITPFLSSFIFLTLIIPPELFSTFSDSLCFELL